MRMQQLCSRLPVGLQRGGRRALYNPSHNSTRSGIKSCILLACSAEIVAGSVDGTVRRFDVRAGLETADDLGGAPHPSLQRACTWETLLFSAAAAPTLASCGPCNRSMEVETADTPTLSGVVSNVGAAVTSVAVSHDGHCLLASCMDGAARLLDKEGGDLLATYRGRFLLSTLCFRRLPASFPIAAAGQGRRRPADNVPGCVFPSARWGMLPAFCIYGRRGCWTGRAAT